MFFLSVSRNRSWNSIAVAAGILLAANTHAQSELLDVSLESLVKVEETPQTLSLSRHSVLQPFGDGTFGDATNFNIGVLFSPVTGFNLRADAWSLQADKVSATSSSGDLNLGPAPRLYIDDSQAGLLERPFVSIPGAPGMESQGIDLSASYVWESDRFGQFIISTRASYVYDMKSTDRLRESSLLPLADAVMGLGAELQSSLTLTWQAGNHSASAVTHYADAFDELSKINLDEFNELVGNMTTLDIQYGYTLKAGRQGNAVFAVGVRSVLDKRSGQVLDLGPLPGEKTGRMAYGSIKYQF